MSSQFFCVHVPLTLSKIFIYYSFSAMLRLCCCLGFSLVVTSRSYFLAAVLGLLIAVLLLLQSMGSRACGLSSCGTRLSCPSMWDLPRPGIEPLTLALASGIFTTGPPGKSPPLSRGLFFCILGAWWALAFLLFVLECFFQSPS